MKTEKNKTSRGNCYGFISNNILPLLAVIILTTLSLLTITGSNSTNELIDLSNKSDTNDSCVECKGFSKEYLFNQNTTLMKEAALNYYTNERLPQSLNGTSKITLKEMLDEKLLYSLVDSAGKKCSTTESYVEVTKLENEYLFKVNLACSDITDYILVHQGCYDYCNETTCTTPEKKQEEKKTETVYEYEFKKSVSCVMSDWSAWSEWSTTREETSAYKREETKTEKVIESRLVEADKEIKTVYNCDQFEGYELVGDKCVKCKGDLDEKPADENPTTYNCDKYPGYELDGDKCVKVDVTTEEKPADENPTTYNCDKYPGYTLSGDKCINPTTSTDEKPADKNPTTYNCDKYPDYKLENNKCVKYSTSTDEKPADENPATYNCDKYPGYTVSGQKCIKKTSKVDTKDAQAVYSYNCNHLSGYTQDGQKCKKSTTSYKDATPNYKTRQVSYSCKKEVCSTKQVLDCSSGTCVLKDEKTCSYVDSTCYKEEKYISSYSCPSGYSNYNSSTKKCSKVTTDTKDAQRVTSYNCKHLSGYTLDGQKCKKTIVETDEKPADKNPTTYNCDKYSGYTLVGDKCVKDVEVTDEKPADENPATYNCDQYEGYELVGEKCVKEIPSTDEKPADENPVSYNCDKYDDFKLVGDKCVKEIRTTEEKPAEENPVTYNCDEYEGYTLYGDKCVKAICENCTEDATKEEIEVCPEGYTEKENKCTKVVNEEKEITYYRYSTRTCTGGSSDTKWSENYNDQTLLGLGYRRTGRKRVLSISK